MSTNGISSRIFYFADSLVGRLHGGLAQVNILASLIFAGMSGSALADVGGLGKIEIEEMRRHGFTASYSGAVTVASATLGPIFPPSIPMILWASVATASPVMCLMAGILPAMLAMVLMMITAAVISAVSIIRAIKSPLT
jgi:TRAP-type C4-dicarboxylate transport system permease large subunit